MATLPKVLSNRWEIGDVLGEGGQAITYVVRDLMSKTEDRYVAKLLRPFEDSKAKDEDEQIHRFRTEVATLRGLNEEGCPGIVRIIDANIDTSKGDLFYVMPLFRAGALSTATKNVAAREYLKGQVKDVDRALQIVTALCETVVFMHERPFQVVHRDIHTGNVFFSDPTARPILGDFGLVYEQRAVSDSPKRYASGELGPWRWRPPELTKASINKRDPKSDVYMLGGVLYELLSGGDYIDDVEPNPGVFAHETKEKDLAGTIADPRITLINQLLRRILRRDPADRLSSRQLLTVLNSLQQSKVELVIPAPDVEEELRKAEAALQKSRQVREDIVRRDLSDLAQMIVKDIGFDQRRPRWQVSRVIDLTGDPPPKSEGITEFVFGLAVRVLVGADLQESKIPFILSRIWIGRSLDHDEIVVISRHPGGQSEVLSKSAEGDARHTEMVKKTAYEELDRLSTAYVPIMTKYS